MSSPCTNFGDTSPLVQPQMQPHNQVTQPQIMQPTNQVPQSQIMQPTNQPAQSQIRPPTNQVVQSQIMHPASQPGPPKATMLINAECHVAE
eukprot:316001_1